MTVITATTAGALLLAGCSTTATTPAAEGGEAKVAAVIKGLDNPFFQSMEDGIKAADSSITVQAAQDITDTSGQADRLSSLAGQDFSCFIINPISGNNLLQGVAQLKSSGKTVVNIDSPVDPDAAASANATPDTYIGTDNVSAGNLAGEHMASLVADGAKVAAIGGIAGDVTSGDRVTGFTEGFGTKGQVLETVSADWDRQVALTKAGDLLRANPDIAGFFVANDVMGLGVARAVADANLTGKVSIISVDGVPEGLAGVESGELTATVAQYPYAIGEMGAQACAAAAAGEELPDNVEAPVALVTKDNVADALKAAPAPFEDYENPFAQ
ncbi:substrate-binding domain-containing protein [Arthrobacter agilis]|uniref:substrate-binding domain-containing protein n=1 Tax=Arthrobacter agilis TaxID=37921 RepID=UPI0027D7F140|nr:substrate-binding domain-containing protein [Arthrobacter agilis]